MNAAALESGRKEAFEALLGIGSLVAGGRVAANWLPDGSFWFVDGAPETTSIKRLDPATGEIGDMFDVEKVRAALSSLLGRALPYAGLPFASFTGAGNEVRFSFEGAGYRLGKSDYSIVAEPGRNLGDVMFGRGPDVLAAPRMFLRPSYYAESMPVPEMASPDGRRLIGLQDFNLAIHFAEDGRVEQLTDDGVQHYGWDVESIRLGAASGGSIISRTINPWSPDGLRLFATKVDQRRTPEWMTMHLLKRHHEVERFKVARAGDALPVVEPYVFDVLQRKAIRIDIATEDKLLLPLGWQADGRSLHFILFARDMREAALYRADPTTGAVDLIHRESGDSFIRIQHQVISGRSGCTMLRDGSGFLWESEADGWNHLYLYDMEGRPLRQLTSGEWPVTDVLAVDSAAGQVYFMAHPDQDRPYDLHLCRVPLAGGAVERLTPDEGVHEVQLAPDFASFVATRSLPHLPPRSEVRRSDGTLVHSFAPADISRLEALDWTLPEQFAVKAADGVTDLWGVIYKPAKFDPAKSYPVVEYIYGGPQIVYTPHNFYTPPNYAFVALPMALPQLDYVVVVLDGRGTPERSKAFHDVAAREWRRHVGEDHACALRNLAAERPWMDMANVGVYGHSWGGYYTLQCMLDHPDVYRAGVASAPGFDAYDYFIYEPYLGGPPGPDNAAAYEDAVLYRDASKLEGDLMIVAGTSDTIPWQNATKMSDALIKADIDHEFVMLPDEGHAYGARKDRYFVGKLVRHFDRCLKRKPAEQA